MAYQQHFNGRIRQELTNSNSRVLELQSILAQKDDEITLLSTQLRQLRDAGAATSPLNRHHADILNEKLKAANAEGRKRETKLHGQIEKLQQQARARTDMVPRARLDAANAELKRLKTALASLQKQFEIEKNENATHGRFPATCPEKQSQLDDGDDDEVLPTTLKKEKFEPPPAAPPSHPWSGTFPQRAPPKPHTPSPRVTRRNAVPPSPADANPPPKRATPWQREPSPRKRARSDFIASDPESGEDLNNDDEFKLDPSASPRDARPAPAMDTSALRASFEFLAVTKHCRSGVIERFHSVEDLSDECDELWDHIRRLVDKWEEAKGGDWKYEFEKTGYKPAVRPCVTTKLTTKGRMAWRPGGEGKFACGKCVREGMPCFTWTGEEFWLLPLHDLDRRYPVLPGLEIRYWINVE
jgi:hypothetical protein